MAAAMATSLGGVGGCVCVGTYLHMDVQVHAPQGLMWLCPPLYVCVHIAVQGTVCSPICV